MRVVAEAALATRWCGGILSAMHRLGHRYDDCQKGKNQKSRVLFTLDSCKTYYLGEEMDEETVREGVGVLE